MNKITIKRPEITKNRITYSYDVEGDWKQAFKLDEPFYVEYNIDISSVPESIAIIPLMCNLLPMAWIFDATVCLGECDKDFYDSIDDIRKGYEGMFPMMKFSAKIQPEKVVENKPAQQDKAAAFFSGGADAFNTLVMHADEKPTLMTVWGADIKFEDINGWNNVLEHLKFTAQKFCVDYVTIKSCLRRSIDGGFLSWYVRESKDSWWHGFQHGIGIIGHAAPVAYVMGKKTVYFASSFTIKEKGLVTCASDPTIDNMLHYCGADTVHDGYEFNRQAKLHNITQFSKKYDIEIPLRVCWQSQGGNNCCSCEKCIRTIYGIYAEHSEPREFGFKYDDSGLAKMGKILKNADNPMIGKLRYEPIQNAMRKNCSIEEIPREIRWFYNIDINKLGVHPVAHKVNIINKKVKRKLGKLKVHK